jgi:hypothetical protein
LAYNPECFEKEGFKSANFHWSIRNDKQFLAYMLLIVKGINTYMKQHPDKKLLIFCMNGFKYSVIIGCCFILFNYCLYRMDLEQLHLLLKEKRPELLQNEQTMKLIAFFNESNDVIKV